MYLLLLFSLLLLSALLAGIGAAFVAAGTPNVRGKGQAQVRYKQILAKFYSHPSRFLYTMQWGYYFTLMLLAGVLFSMMVAPPAVLFSIILYLLFAILFILFLEAILKPFFRLHAALLLHTFIYPTYGLYQVFLIPVWLTTTLANRILGFFFYPPPVPKFPDSRPFDITPIAVSDISKTNWSELDTKLIGRALHLRDIRTRDCMVPRLDIQNINANASLQTLEKLFQQTGLSRILVVEQELDNVLGYVHHQQLLKQPTSIRQIVMELPFVPEVMRGTDLLNKFINERINIAGVVDEFGVLKGLITLEDIMEELFGEIDDEHDEDTYLELQLPDGSYLFSGRLEIDYLNEKYTSLSFPKGNYRTLSGYLVTAAQVIPKQGAEIILNDYLFVLESVTETKIDTVRLIQLKTS